MFMGDSVAPESDTPREIYSSTRGKRRKLCRGQGGSHMARITGVGGIFFKCDNPKAVSDWYREVLGVAVEDWGGALFRPSPNAPTQVWAPFAADTTHFAPSAAPFMVNFVVDDLDGM